ncbi:MAG: 7,8-didemethyl-8-hydroxy-5-deazariboflavin synthase subunit CofH [Cyanobacteria bacterium P01_F01_bin.42]
MSKRFVSTILSSVLAGHDLSNDDAVWLLSQTDPAVVEQVRRAADALRQSLVGDTVSYVVNRNINFTNICEQHCSFCAFRRSEKDQDAYWLSDRVMLEKAKEALNLGATELCIQGGLHARAKRNGRSLDYYTQMVRTLKAHCPELHIHAFSPQEVQFIAREDQLSFLEVLQALKAAGVNSLPGTAAEVLDDQVRRILCPEKINSQTWLTIVAAAHQIGLPTTSTMLCGHVETPVHQVRHLDRLRCLQQNSLRECGVGISEFILLPYVGQFAPPRLRRRVGRDQPELLDVLKLTAVSRLFMGRWIVNHQPSWVKLGIEGAQDALRWGCNDLGGTLMEEHITTSAGAKGGTGFTALELEEAIAAIGRPYRQRTTLYKDVSGVAKRRERILV